MEPEALIKTVCFLAFIFFSMAEPILRKVIGWIQPREEPETPIQPLPGAGPAGQGSSRTPFEQLQQWVASLEDADADPVTGQPPSAKAIRKPPRKARRAIPAGRPRPTVAPQSHGGHLDDHHLTPSIQEGRSRLPSEHGGDLDSHRLRIGLPVAGDVSPSVHGGHVDERRLLSSLDHGRVPERAKVVRDKRNSGAALRRRLSGLNVLQQAVVMSEVLSPSPGAAAYKKRQAQGPRQVQAVDPGGSDPAMLAAVSPVGGGQSGVARPSMGRPGGGHASGAPPVTEDSETAKPAEPQQPAAENGTSSEGEADMENESGE